MKKLQVHSLPLKEVIADIANALGTSFTHECEQFSVEIPVSWGHGKIKGINFEGGLGLLIYECQFNVDLEISFTINKTHPLKFLFCLEGDIIHHFEKDRERHPLQQYQNIIVASEGYNGHVLHFKKDQFTEIYSLEVDRRKFKAKMSCELVNAKPYLREIFEDDMANNSFYYNGLYSLVLAETFDEMKAQDSKQLIGQILLEGQSYRMLAEQLNQYDDDFGVNTDKGILRKSEAHAIKEAVEIMKMELDSLDSLHSIAQRVGLSSKKFQSGFQHFFGKTANEYLQFMRLNLAKQLLINTEDSIQEIKEKVGFNSQSYFTELFKKTFNVTPSSFRKAIRNNRKNN